MMKKGRKSIDVIATYFRLYLDIDEINISISLVLTDEHEEYTHLLMTICQQVHTRV